MGNGMKSVATKAVLALLFVFGIAAPARAQQAAEAEESYFEFAGVEQARAVLGARDDYVLATAALERSAKLHTIDTVDQDRFMQYMRDTAREWSEEQRKNVTPLL